jgi:mRNA interferase HigB
MIPLRLIAASTLAAYAAQNPGATAALANWRQTVKVADWKSMGDVTAGASTAKVLNSERVRFEVAGGKFRLIASINFRLGIVFVKFIGTHQEYDRIDALTVSQF